MAFLNPCSSNGPDHLSPTKKRTRSVKDDDDMEEHEMNSRVKRIKLQVDATEKDENELHVLRQEVLPSPLLPSLEAFVQMDATIQESLAVQRFYEAMNHRLGVAHQFALQARGFTSNQEAIPEVDSYSQTGYSTPNSISSITELKSMEI